MVKVERSRDIEKAAKDALYVSVGLGVIAFQKLQVQRQELRKNIESRRKVVEERLAGVRDVLRPG